MRIAEDAKSLIFEVTAASPAIRVKDSRLWFQNSVFPPKPCSFIIERAKSMSYNSAFWINSLLSAKEGLYCGAVVDIN